MNSTGISYMATDFKYSKEHGIKICEVQHGAFSSMNGDIYLSEDENGTIANNFAKYFDKFDMKKWMVGAIYSPIKRCLLKKGWIWYSSFEYLFADSEFKSGIVFATCEIANGQPFDVTKYPDVILIDAGTFGLCNNKIKMNSLFTDELAKYKADWVEYPKKYDGELIESIKKTMQSDLYVIKPFREFLANGIIVASSEELDSVMQKIISKDKLTGKYFYWQNNKDPSFIIEKYYKSDYTTFNNDEYYDPTMRIAFILNNSTYHCLGGFWKLPKSPVEGSRDLNDTSISHGAGPFYKTVDKELFEEVNKEMETCMLLFDEQIQATIIKS